LVAAFTAFTAFAGSACFKETARETIQTDSAIAPRDSASPSTGDRAGSYVGVRHDPLPAGVKGEGGAMLTGTASSYAFIHVRTPRGDMIWLDSIASTPAAEPSKTVRAELAIPPLAADERLFMASCDVNSRLDSRVLAIVINEPGVTKFTKIRQAWRVNERAGRFEVIPIAGITCEDPGGDR
jgi:hypothetical protein